jgi:hypothetical protein
MKTPRRVSERLGESLDNGSDDADTKSWIGRSKVAVLSSPSASAKTTAFPPSRLTFRRYCIEDWRWAYLKAMVELAFHSFGRRCDCSSDSSIELKR